VPAATWSSTLRPVVGRRQIRLKVGDGKETAMQEVAYPVRCRLLFLGPLPLILFRQKYPRWWFDAWVLVTDRYPPFRLAE
jgi:hypothetical protein